jgi:hypothetical protein
VPLERRTGKRVVQGVVVAFLLIQALAVGLGESGAGIGQRLFWPFNDESMFVLDSDEVGMERSSSRYQLVLLDGARETPLDYDIIHPHPYMAEWGFRYRLAHIPTRWTDQMSRGLASAAQRYRCTNHLDADAVAIFQVTWDNEALIRGQPYRSRILFRKIPLPLRCES